MKTLSIISFWAFTSLAAIITLDAIALCAAGISSGFTEALTFIIFGG